MTQQALFYEQAAPITREAHGNWCVDTQVGYAFSRNTNAIPLMSVEFAPAAREYPIVFLDKADTPLPVSILGLQNRENLFIDEQGQWGARYIPAYVRRYPFIFLTHDDGKTFTVGVDEGYAGWNQEGQGDSLFDENGEQSAYLQRTVAFLREYEAQYRFTRAFCDRLKSLDLLEPMQASIAMSSGAKYSLTGFNVVSRERLKALPRDTVLELLDGDALELIHAHLLSLQNFSALIDRLSAKES